MLTYDSIHPFVLKIAGMQWETPKVDITNYLQLAIDDTFSRVIIDDSYESHTLIIVHDMMGPSITVGINNSSS